MSGMPKPRKPASPFRYFNSSPEVIRLVVMMYMRFPLSLRNVEDMMVERGLDISHETVRFWWNRFGPMFAAELRRRRVSRMKGFRHWNWHLDEMYVRLNGKMVYLWRAVDHEGEILESFVTKNRDKKAALLQRLAAVRGRLSLCADQAAAAKWWLSMPMASVSAEGPMPKALSTRRTSPLMPGCRHQGRACPLRRARMTSNPLIVA